MLALTINSVSAPELIDKDKDTKTIINPDEDIITLIVTNQTYIGKYINIDIERLDNHTFILHYELNETFKSELDKCKDETGYDKFSIKWLNDTNIKIKEDLKKIDKYPIKSLSDGIFTDKSILNLKNNGTLNITTSGIVDDNITLGFGTIQLKTIKSKIINKDKKTILGNDYNLILTDDNIESYDYSYNNTCYSESTDFIITIDNCHQHFKKSLTYDIIIKNKQDKPLSYTFLTSSGNDISDTTIEKESIKEISEYISKDMIGSTGDGFYTLKTIDFKSNESVTIKYTIRPKKENGKFNIIGHDTGYDLTDAITEKRYIFLDPTWDDAKVSYWDMDTDGSIPDSWGSNTGTILETVYNSSGYIGGSYWFDGVNDLITVSNFPDHDNAFTILAWVYYDDIDTTVQWNRVFQYGTGATDKSWMICSYSTGTTWAYGMWGRITSTTGIEIAVGQWHHVALTWDGTNARFYLNGELNGTKTQNPNLDATVPLTFGGRASANYMQGRIDEIAFFNKTLNITEISDIYNNGLDQADSTHPTYSQNSTNSTISGTDILHALKLDDETALDTYIFRFDNGTGTLVNDSLVDISGTSHWSNVTKGINHTIGTTIRWQVFANDTNNNWNSTPIYSYTTTAADSCSNCDGTSDCYIDCSDACTLSDNLDMGGYDMIINQSTSGTHTTTITGVISNYGDITTSGYNSTDRCNIICKSGGGFID